MSIDNQCDIYHTYPFNCCRIVSYVYNNTPSIYTSSMNVEQLKTLSTSEDLWDRVLALLSTVSSRYNPMFRPQGTVLNNTWGTAYEKIVNIMYWADRLSRNGLYDLTITDEVLDKRNLKHLQFIALELKTTPYAIHNIMQLDPDYDGVYNAD